MFTKGHLCIILVWKWKIGLESSHVHLYISGQCHWCVRYVSDRSPSHTLYWLMDLQAFLLMNIIVLLMDLQAFLLVNITILLILNCVCNLVIRYIFRVEPHYDYSYMSFHFCLRICFNRQSLEKCCARYFINEFV